MTLPTSQPAAMPDRAVARARAAEEAALEARDRFRALVEHSTELLAVIDVDRRVSFASPAFERVLQLSVKEVEGSFAYAHVHPDDHEAANAILDELRPGCSRTAVTRLGSAARGWTWVEVVLTDLRDAPSIQGIVVNARDVTEYRASRALLTGQSALLERLARPAPLNDTLAAIGVFIEDHTGHVARVIIGDRAEAANAASGAVTSATPVTLHHTGETLGCLVVEGDLNPRAAEVAQLAAGMAAIAIERDRADRRLVWHSSHDALTDLPNRQLFLECLAGAVIRGDHSPGGVAVLLIDLDHFKSVNDSLGQAAGDDVLVEIASRLRAAARGADTVARLGGDEFVVLCEDVSSAQEAIATAHRLVAAVAVPVVLGDRSVTITATCGVTFAPDAGVPAEFIVRDASGAMARAKERGGAQVRLFDADAGTAAVERLETETALRSAVESGGLWVAYQPQVRLDTGATVGYEALVRWDRPGVGQVPPEQFIPIAEASDLIVAIGRMVMEDACRVGASWDGPNPPIMSVNLSVRQFSRSDVPAMVAEVLAAAGLSPHRLLLEITESALVEEAEGLVQALETIRETGVRMAIDDFGTRYSSLVYLRRLPIDQIKIDASFVQGLDTIDEDRAIVTALARLAVELNLEAVAEGVECASQAELLLELGCPVAQGYLFGRGVPETEIDRTQPRHLEAVRR